MEVLGGLILGLLGSMHCLGMCGPIVLAASAGNGGRTLLPSNIIYHTGRWLTYALLGLVFGSIGQGLEMLFYQQTVAIITGSFILLWAVLYYSPIFKRFTPGVFSFFTNRAGKFLSRQDPAGKFFLGFLNGFLPCGLVYLAATTSILFHSPWESAAYMVLFGIGTTPALLALVMGKSLLRAKFNISINRWIPGIAGLMGIILIIRGLGLGIPYLSPKIEFPGEEGKVNSCCTTGLVEE